MNYLVALSTLLANALCGGSARKLIAGWWYSILALSIILSLMSLVLMTNRSGSPGEVFTTVWSSLLLVVLSISGTLIMRRFHNGFAMGFFLGSLVATSQLFFMLILAYRSYAATSYYNRQHKEEILMEFLCFIQATLLGVFACILGAYKNKIIDNTESLSVPQDVGASYSAGGSMEYQGSTVSVPSFKQQQQNTPV